MKMLTATILKEEDLKIYSEIFVLVTAHVINFPKS